MKAHPSAAVLLAFAVSAAAQPVPPGPVPLLSDAGIESLIRSVAGASRLPAGGLDSGRVPQAIRVLGREQLEASRARTLQELLSALPGVVLFDQVGNGWQQTLDLRGFNGNPIPATVVLVDGVRVNEADFGAVHWHLLPLSDLERVEVLPGPQTLFGKNALGGVISVTTRRGTERPSGAAELEGGSFGRARLAASAAGPAGPLRWRLSASRQIESGWRRDSDARIHSFAGRVDWQEAGSSLSLAYRYGDDALKQAGSLTASELGVDRRGRVSLVETDSLQHLVSAAGRLPLGGGAVLALQASHRQRLENTPLNLGRTSVSASRSAMATTGATLQLEHDGRLFGRRATTVAGVEGSFARIDSDSAGRFGAFPFRSASNVRERQLGLFASETVDLLPELLSATAGARWDRDTLQAEDEVAPANNGWRGYHRASPRVGLNLTPARGVEVYASLADSFRTPTANEILALGPFSSTPLLKPVKARSLEAGARSRGTWGEASLAAYRTVVRDEIFPVFDPTAGFGQNRNIPRTRRQGFELELKPKLAARFEGLVSWSYTEATFQSDFDLDKAPFPATQHASSGDLLPAVPRHALTVGLTVRPRTGLALWASERCAGSQAAFGDESNTEPRLGGWCVLGVGAELEKGPVRVFLRADNALDRRYESRGILGTNPVSFGLERFLVPAPGIAVSGGLSWRWEN